MGIKRRLQDIFASMADDDGAGNEPQAVDASSSPQPASSSPSPVRPGTSKAGTLSNTPRTAKRARYGFRYPVPGDSPSNLFSVSNKAEKTLNEMDEGEERPADEEGDDGGERESGPKRKRLPSLLSIVRPDSPDFELPNDGIDVPIAQNGTRTKKAGPRVSLPGSTNGHVRGQRRAPRRSLPAPTRLSSSSSDDDEPPRAPATADASAASYTLPPAPRTKSFAELRVQIVDPAYTARRLVPPYRTVRVPGSFTLERLALLIQFLFELDIKGEGEQGQGHHMRVVDSLAFRAGSHCAGQMKDWCELFPVSQGDGASSKGPGRGRGKGKYERSTTVGQVWRIVGRGAPYDTRAIVYTHTAEPENTYTMHVTFQAHHHEPELSNEHECKRGLGQIPSSRAKDPFDAALFSSEEFDRYLEHRGLKLPDEDENGSDGED